MARNAIERFLLHVSSLAHRLVVHVAISLAHSIVFMLITSHSVRSIAAWPKRAIIAVAVTIKDNL